MALSTGQKQGAMQKEYNSVTMRDDKKFYFGDDQDVSLEYDEDGTNTLLVDGGDVTLADDHKFYCGTNQDGYLTYDETGTNVSDTFGLADGTSGMVFSVKSVLNGGESGFAKGGLCVDLTSGLVYMNVSDTTDAKWSDILA